MSRIIVKNIPPNISEEELRRHFNQKGDITDVKIMKSEKGVSRKFAFLGFKEESQANTCIKYFNNTFLRTSRIVVEHAKVQGDKTLAKPWSRHSKWDSASNATSNSKEKGKAKSIDSKEASKESKISKLLEISKLTSTKSKFDALGKKLSEGAESKNADKQEKATKEEKGKGKNAENSEPQTNQDISDLFKLDAKRLYIRNLPFEMEAEAIRPIFEKYGEVTELHIPKNFRTGQTFGYGYVSYSTLESTVLALGELDKSIFQGRIIHIEPAESKKESAPALNILSQTGRKSDYKDKKEKHQMDNFSDQTNWNYLFINQNAAIEAVARKLNLPKEEILSKDNSNLAVQVSAMETLIINETKSWLGENGIDLEVFKGSRQNCNRSKTTIIIKNIAQSVKEEDLSKIFSRFGMLSKFILSPSNTLGIAEFVDEKHAENCLKNVSYMKVEGLPLYLEYAPDGIITSKTKKIKTVTDVKNGIDLVNSDNTVVFLTNLNFKSTKEDIAAHFKENGFKPVEVKIATHKKGTEVLSSGFAFVELESEKEASRAIKTMQGTILDDHSLKLSIAKSKVEKEVKLIGNKRSSDTKGDYDYTGEDIEGTKLLVKNLAFEATKNELRDLLKGYGEVKTVRFPTKIDGTHRGFAFVDFVSHDEAKNVFSNLQNTHFYGRKLVFEWAEKEKSLEELRSKTERKVKLGEIETHRKQIKSTLEPTKTNKKAKHG